MAELPFAPVDFHFLYIPIWLKAGLWGLLSGSALLLGALIGYFASIPQKSTALIMAFGGGVLVSALAFDLMDEAFDKGGIIASASGFVAGGVVYTMANYLVDQKGAKHRKRSGNHQSTESDTAGSGTALAIGALIDGIPESIAIGVSMIEGGAVSIVAVVAVFLSNLPEGLSSASGMKKAGRSRSYIFMVWGSIAVLSSLAAILGYAFFQNLSANVIAFTIAVAAGGILAMLSTTMMPEAFEEGRNSVGLVTVLGFLAAFVLTKMG